MRSNIPEKVIQLINEIDRLGQADPAGLTVMRKWLDDPPRLLAFAVWVAQRTAARKGKTTGTAGALLDETRALLPSEYGEGRVRPSPDRAVAAELHARFKTWLDSADGPGSDPKAAAKNRKLQVVEQALSVILWHQDSQEHGYRLAVDHLQHHDPRLGVGLSGPSRGKLSELVRFMFTIEGYEELEL